MLVVDASCNTLNSTKQNDFILIMTNLNFMYVFGTSKLISNPIAKRTLEIHKKDTWQYTVV